ncbi:hypothetical protein KUTeg_003187 [Tegillarca granosa]|uniref:Uncharacterized protein n=1 Tax=Tegillarca granosa TaxID=220873 RepID=A0ABQ9FLD6_TEGGR|nr:hypothetical protein KUTeg_003187 [Tegillarca granosa]
MLLLNIVMADVLDIPAAHVPENGLLIKDDVKLFRNDYRSIQSKSSSTMTHPILNGSREENKENEANREIMHVDKRPTTCHFTREMNGTSRHTKLALFSAIPLIIVLNKPQLFDNLTRETFTQASHDMNFSVENVECT